MTTVAGPLVRRGARRRSATERTTALRAPDRAEPWGRAAWVVLLVLAGSGLVGMIVGWAGISGTADLEEQARWLGLGIGSLILAGLGMVAWLVAGLISLAALRRSVLRDLAVRYPAPADRRDETAPQQAVGTFGIATGMLRYHRAECETLAGKDVRWLDSESLHFAGTLPCGMCKPDEASGAST